MKTLEVLAVLIEVGRGKYIIAQRPIGKSFGGLCEFPGGQIKKGETHEQCAYREIENEEFFWGKLRIRLTDCYLGKNTYIDEINNLRIKLHCYHAAYISGEFISTEHRDVRIVSPDEFCNYDFAPADMFFVRRLQARSQDEHRR